MSFRSFLSVLVPVLVPFCWSLVRAQEASEPGGTNATSPGGGNQTRPNPGGMFTGLGVDGSMIQRALYVLIGISGIGVLYFLIRAVRLKKPASRKKYGLLHNYDDSVEMEAVESEEDDTLYEARSLRR
ncbi:protein FAM174C [Cololabis saira]|uniref:protein FAM174C n=1 Tax=Cololabis saira TaxID=129043 RepID=UPI002AD4BAA8|nr:protein FAM174C [Cololabis saira]